MKTFKFVLPVLIFCVTATVAVTASSKPREPQTPPPTEKTTEKAEGKTLPELKPYPAGDRPQRHPRPPRRTSDENRD
jgi:hypothetical protein